MKAALVTLALLMMVALGAGCSDQATGNPKGQPAPPAVPVGVATAAQRDVPVQVIALGQQVAIVGLPGEIFVELGLAIKKGSPFPVTVIAELANGSIGYIPNRSAYAEGNYEVISARCAEGAGELLAESAVKLLHQLRTDR